MSTSKWEKAPEWAQWWAVDNDGIAFWYEDRPRWTGVDFMPKSGRILLCCTNGTKTIFPRGLDSLTKKPGVITGPDWSKAPKLAKWWAVDESGEAYWYDEQPKWGGSIFSLTNLTWGAGTYKNHPYGPVSLHGRHLPEDITAGTILHNAKQHIGDRARQYDSPGGERSMASTVNAFNSITGHNLTETDGWQFMEILKIARSRSGKFKADNYEDGAAYAALAGESASRESKA